MSDIEAMTTALNKTLQTKLANELMQSWSEGVQAGLTMAHKMAEAIRDDATDRYSEARFDGERAELEAQMAVLTGLMKGLLAAADEVSKRHE